MYWLKFILLLFLITNFFEILKISEFNLFDIDKEILNDSNILNNLIRLIR